MKKSIILFLLAFMSNSLCAQNPVKVGDYWYEVNSGDNTAMLVKDPVNKDGYTGDVVIPDEITTTDDVTYKVTGIGERAFCGCKILSVTIGNNVTFFGDHAFSYSTVASATIGGEYDKSISGVDIGWYAFYACENLTSVVFGDNVYAIGKQAFQNCPKLSYVVLGKRLRSIGASAFFNCDNLTDIYCKGEYSPYESGSPYFEKNRVRSMSLHIPEAAAGNYYSSTWTSFGETDKMVSDELPTCATPEIVYNSGTISFTCATEGVEYNSSVEYVENEFNNVSEYPAPSHFRVKVVAVKKGYIPSETAEQEFTLPGYVDVKTGEYKQGDVNKDGNVNIADNVKLLEIILPNQE